MSQSLKSPLRLGVVLAGALAALATPASKPAYPYSGFYGQKLYGQLDATYDVRNLQNASNVQTPLAVVGPGVEFSASFDDVLNQHWNLSLDLQDNYQIVMHTSSPNPNANIATGNFIHWHLYNFEFHILNVTKVSVPADDRSTIIFDNRNIWIFFDALAAWDPYTSYTFQIYTDRQKPNRSHPGKNQFLQEIASSMNLEGDSTERQWPSNEAESLSGRSRDSYRARTNTDCPLSFMDDLGYTMLAV